MMNKKLVPVALSFGLAISSFGYVQAEETVDPYGPVSEETTVIHIGREESANVTYPEGQNSQNNYIVQYLQDKLNVEYIYDFSVDASSHDTKVAMAIASGEIPDVMDVTYLQLVQLVKAGAVEDMTDAFYTYRSEGLTKCFDSTNGIAENLATFDGRMMAIPSIYPGMDSVPVLYIRGDWLEECGLEAPSTWDDLVNVAKTFMEKNPGGNVKEGIAVSKDIVQEDGGNFRIDGLFSSQEAYPKAWLTQEDGSVVYGSITEETKEALGKIRTLVEEGIIDPSFAVRDSTQCEEVISSGQAGIFMGSWWSNQYPVVSILEASDDSVSWIPVLCPLSEEGTLNVAMKNPVGRYIVVKKGCSEEIKEAVVKTVNYQYDIDQAQAEGIRPNGDADPFSWNYFPINVLHCDYDAKELQIQAVMDVIDGKMDYEDQTGDGKTWYRGYTTVMDQGFRAVAEMDALTANAWGWATGAWEVQRNNDIVNKIYAATYAKTESMESLWATLETLEDEYFLQVLTGDASLDEFDDFVAQWNALGGDVVTQEVSEIANAQ